MGTATAPATWQEARRKALQEEWHGQETKEILEDRWDGFVSLPDGRMSPKFLRLCRSLDMAVAAVARYQDEDESPLEDDLLDLIHEFIVRKVGEGEYLTNTDLGLDAPRATREAAAAA
jgi:hypothetical protein